MGTQLLQEREHSPPNFWPMSVVAKRLDGSMLLGMEVGLGPGHIVLDEDPAAS